MSRLDELKAQRAQLEDLIRTGVLTGDAAGQARDRLEAQIIAAVAPAAAPAPAADAGTAAAAPETTPTAEAAPATAERPSRGLWLGLLSFVLLFGVGGYAWLGNPAGLAVGPGMPAAAQATAGSQMPSKADFSAMTDRLAERLKTTPDDVEGWTMLGRSYSLLERFPQALVAYQRVLALRPQDAQAHADVADAMAMSNGRKLDGEPEKLITRALELDPDNAKALGLAGTLAFERGDAATAARHWERALKATQPGSEMASRLREAVDEARKSAGLPALPGDAAALATAAAAAAPPASGSAPGAGASIQAHITLAPALAARAAPGDTVFIFARSPQGGRAPLAIQRRQVKDLPIDVTLDDSMAMSPAMRLSTVTQVIIGARISKSGNAMPQPGDLQGLSPVVAVGTRGLQLQIGEVLP
jgi:cytochrome c-type biogenesis protein CcmH